VNKAVSQKTLVLGLGNPLSGDDSFGVRTLEALKRILQPLPQNVVLADAGTDLLNHIEDFSSCDRVVLIDAVLDPEAKLGKPGSVLVLEENEFSSWPEASPGVHQITPLLGVKLFRNLHPEAQTKLFLVALLVDQLKHQPHYATEAVIAQSATTLREIL
jgi:hydrogenase maturation protease